MIRRAACAACLAAFAAGCGRTSDEERLLRRTAEALGGIDRILAVRSLALEGEGDTRRLGQNRAPDGDLPPARIASLKRTIDFVQSRARQRTEILLTYVPNPAFPPQRQDVGVAGPVAYNVSPDGSPARAGDHLARDRRAQLIVHHPIGILKAALDPASVVSQYRVVREHHLVDVATGDGESFTLAVDGATALPAGVSSVIYNDNLGDIVVETSFGAYQDIGGLRLPTRLATRFDDFPQDELRVTTQTVDADTSDLPSPRSAADVPVAPADVAVEEVARGLWRLPGSHHSVLIEFADHLVLFEVPQNEARTLAVLARAREIRPGKPVTHAIVSHHHFDHSGGLRAAVAEGLTIIAHERTASLFQALVTRKHTRLQDALSLRPAPLLFRPVDDRLELRDAFMEVHLYHVPEPHSDTSIMAYVPRERLVIQADAFNSAIPTMPWAGALRREIERRGLKVDRHVPIHGPVVAHAELVKLAPSR